ncbi:hypothetical protein ES703_12315 [subsurface metagenome]
MLEGQDDEIIYRLIHIALFDILGDNGQCAGAGTPGRARDQQKCICVDEALAGPYRFNYLIAILFGDLGAQFVDLADAMSASLPSANKDAVLVIRLNAGQATEVGNISVDSKGIGDNIDTTLNMCPTIKSGKFISNSAATLPKTNYN